MEVMVIHYSVLIFLFIAFVFYYLVRYYLNKCSNFKLPILMERYHDDPFLNLVQGVLMVISLLVGYLIASFFI